jgi:hypothetical protein
MWGRKSSPEGVTGGAAPELDIEELSTFLSSAPSLQHELCQTPISERMAVFDAVGALWKKRCESGMLDEVLDALSTTTGYARNLMDIEAEFVPHMLGKATLKQNLSMSFKGSPDGLHRFVEVSGGERYRHLPAGPVFIISSGNSLIPPLIPTTLSLLTGNATVLKPSLSNYGGVRAVYSLLHEVAETSATASLMARALCISYFSHDSPALAWMLEKAPVGVINFWGAEPARSLLGVKAASNPHHPAYLVNGPLTGCAVIDEPSAHQAAPGLAQNMVLYDQQLCSSPTTGCFIGSWESAVAFAKETGGVLDELGASMPMKVPEGSMFALNNARKMLLFKGCTVISSNKPDNPWTIVLSKGKPALDGIMQGMPELGLHARRRFFELVVYDSLDAAGPHICSLPLREAYRGIDRVQTIGLCVEDSLREAYAERLALCGPYRIVPLDDMYMRSAAEPYDGINLAQVFTYTSYMRDKSMGILEKKQ